jgi:hypothetical protein
MRISIVAEPVGPLKILSSLPIARLAVLEGLNGIGKSVTVRLLLLCTGEIPYSASSPAWRSFCEGLGPFRVTIEDVRGADSIVISGDSRAWLDAKLGRPTSQPEMLRTIDGREVNAAELRRLLAVYRLAGDEGIEETLARDAEALADAVDRLRPRLVGPESDIFLEVESAIDAARRVLPSTTRESYSELKADAEAERRAREEALKHHRALRARRDALETIEDILHQLEHLASLTPELESEAKQVDTEIGSIQRARDDLDRRIKEVAGQLAGHGPAKRELTLATQTLTRNRSNLSTSVERLVRLAASAEVAPEYAAISTRGQELRDALEALKREQARLDAAPAMRDLLEVAAVPFTEGEQNGLGDEIAIADGTLGVELTVSQTRNGMLARRADLEGQPPPAESEDILRRLQQTAGVLEATNRALSAADEVETYRRRVEQNETRLARAIRSLGGVSAKDLEELEAEKRVFDEQLLKLAERRADIRQRLGGISSPTAGATLNARLNQLFQEHQVNRDSLDSALSEAPGQEENAAVVAADAARRADESKQRLVQAELEVRQATSGIRRSSQFAWLRDIAPSDRLPDPKSEISIQLGVIHPIYTRVAHLYDRLTNETAQLAAVSEALRAAGRHLRGQERLARVFVEDTERWLSKRFSTWFNSPRVRSLLLPQATSEIVVDLGRREVQWLEKDRTGSRPLDAFSSGEQAFAYTRARLAGLDDAEVRPANRLIVLDEFGAFIAHDRLELLLRYLEERALEHSHDQVLVILPLSRDYAAEATGALPSDARRYGALADQVQRLGLAIREIVA